MCSMAEDARTVRLIDKEPAGSLETHAWQVEHIRRGLREADAGEFASDRELRQTLARLKPK
jgi:predicted transcriptional regulator